MEREADADITAGRVTTVEGVDDLEPARLRPAEAVKFEVTASLRSDWNRLSTAERRLFHDLLPAFNEARDRIAADPGATFPASLRVKDVEGAPGIVEMTWSFSGPDGRATFEWVSIDGAGGVRWRRIADTRS